MENYTLAPDEVLLYKGTVTEAEDPDTEIELLLTNLNIVFVRGLAEEILLEQYPVSDIKVYKDTPQLKQKNRRVEIFLTSGEKTVVFKTFLDAARFTEQVMELITGQSVLVRGAGKFKKTVDGINAALGMDIVEEARKFGVDAVSQAVNKAIPSGVGLLAGKKKKRKK